MLKMLSMGLRLCLPYAWYGKRWLDSRSLRKGLCRGLRVIEGYI